MNLVDLLLQEGRPFLHFRIFIVFDTIFFLQLDNFSVLVTQFVFKSAYLVNIGDSVFTGFSGHIPSLFDAAPSIRMGGELKNDT